MPQMIALHSQKALPPSTHLHGASFTTQVGPWESLSSLSLPSLLLSLLSHRCLFSLCSQVSISQLSLPSSP